ncbi:alpha/beta hydrolase-fold protein [uncultured Aquimarina sp.]|uniref:alpha/beta hydrolase n=1 Tax=uncultured Aquimarina sp. TaxID=575652 RepID=UPI002631665F|nr:alpha/beta hydrolase-fold protein [uncultured Aquimarina sp.]
MNYSAKLKAITFVIFFMIFFLPNAFGQYLMKGSVINDTITSKVLEKNKVGLSTKRNIKIYLPPSYATSKKNYPVVYYLHNVFSNPSIVINDHKTPEIIDKNISEDRSNEFVFVVADFTSPTIGSLFENSSTSGYWLDFITKELVVYIDQNYRTIPNNNSRAVIGHFMGGRGALKLGMAYPEVFNIVYAMHPVATGTGYLPRASLDIDWKKIHSAKSYKVIEGTGRTQIFTSICQAFLPNTNRPPFYCDFLFEKDDKGVLKIHPKNIRKEQKEFHLDEKLDEYADNLRSLKAIAFDWARFDQTQAHVISNRRFSKKLMDIGVDHQGIEFVGDPWNKYWGDEGRIAKRVLPFLNEHLKF